MSLPLSENGSNGGVVPSIVWPPSAAFTLWTLYQPLDDPARDHTEQEILDAERCWQREKRGRELAPGGTDSVGLALSGGGIRSATFNLGVLQSLAKLEVTDGTSTKKTLLDRIDYLSTVSGGGYIGAWLIANWKEGNAAKALNDARNESPQVLHLRRYSRYLAPEDGMLNADTWTMASIWLRNTVLVQAMVACWVFALLLFVRLLVALFDVLAGWPPSPIAKLSSWMAAASGIVEHGFSGWLPKLLTILALLVGWIYVAVQLKRVPRTPLGGTAKRRNAFLKAILLMFISAFGLALTFGFSGWLPLIMTTATLLVGWTFMGVELRRVANAESGALEQPDVLLWVVMPMFISACGLAIAFVQNVVLRWIPNFQEALGGGFEVRQVSWDSLVDFAGRWEIVLIFALAGYLLALTGVARKVSRYDWSKRTTLFLSVVTGLVAGIVAWILTGWWIEMVIFFGLFGVASFFLGKKQSPRRWGLALLAGLASGGLVWLFIHILVRMMWSALSFSEHHLAIARLYLGPVILLGGISLVVAIIGLLGRSLSDPVREWVSRLGAWLGITLVVWVAGKALALHGPILVDYILGMKSPSWIKWPSILGWLAATIGGVLAGKSGKTNGAKSSEDRTAWGRELFARIAPWVALVGLLLLASWLVNGMVHLSMRVKEHDAAVPGNAFTNVAAWWLVGFVFLGLLLVHRIDLNEFSMNQFYRNRLVRCYLGAARVGGKNARKPHPFAGFDFDDDFAIADLANSESTYRGPYPILCGALNTSSGGGLDTQERKAESFIFTPITCGSSRERAEHLPGSALHAFRSSAFFADGGVGKPEWSLAGAPATDKKIKPLTLGTCVSISGAAVSPNWGYHTSPVTAFFLTLFNARLGWWMPNPANRPAKTRSALSRVFWKDTAPWRATHPRTVLGWLSCLKDELFGGASPVSSFVNITDGGHFENLGIYELVRRRCHFIICSDGEEDGALQFNGLGTAIRRCRIDFGVEIVIDVSQIGTVDAQGKSKASCAIGRIKYPPTPEGGKESRGILVYLKLSVTGSESADVNQYRAQHEQFPHESTGDQFFTESQFESYRKLGLTVGRDALKLCWNASKDQAAPPAPDEDLNRRMTSFKEVLSDYWAVPARSQSGTSSRHTESLMKLWQRQASPGSQLKFMDEDLLSNFKHYESDFGTLQIAGANSNQLNNQVVREAAYTCQEILQFMENVFVDLQLEDESAHPDYNGWMNLFKHWAAMPALRLAWKHTKQDYGKRFQIFCRHKLEMEK